MKLISFYISLFFLSSGIAQESEMKPIPLKESKWQFGLSYSPEVSYRILTFDNEASYSGFYYPAEDYIPTRKESDQAKYGYSAKIFFGYRISEMFTLETGIGYTDFGDGYKPTAISFGYNPEPEYAIMTGRTHIGFIKVPVSLRFNLGGKRYQWSISAGVAPAYRMRYNPNFKIKYPNGELYPGYNILALDRDEISTFILEAHISGGVDIQLNNKTSLRIAPEFRITATDTYSNVPVSAHYFNAGISIGSVFRL